jgi:hypothetical protein
MKCRVIMVLASGVLAVSLLATDAQARGAEGYRGGRGGAHMGAFGGARMRVFGGVQMAGIHRGCFGTGNYYPLILGIGY